MIVCQVFLVLIFLLQLVKELSPYTWSHGMLTFLSFCNSERIMGRYSRAKNTSLIAI